MPVPAFADIVADQEIPSLVRTPAPADLIRYAAVSEDFAWQHWDQSRMESLGFPGVIVHGWLTLTYMCQVVTAWLPPEHAKVLRYSARHKRPTFPGEVTLGGKVTAKSEEAGARLVDLDLWARDTAGQITTSGTMRLQMLDG